MALETSLILMAADWITGGIFLPSVFGKSPKSPNGALESRAGWEGLCRKGMTLFYILIAACLDRLLGMDYIRNAVCIGFIANELLSIVENAEKEAAGTALVRYGRKGTLVVLAEGLLAEKEIYLGNIDGIFGTGMGEAVRRLQTDHLLETDGVIGRNTWTELFAM